MKKLLVLIVILSSLTLSSCWSTRTYCGSYREDVRDSKMDSYKYAKSKQAYLFWGLIPLGRTTVATPDHGSCEIRTRHGFLDAFVSLITGGIITMQTIKVSAPRGKQQQVQQQQLQQQQMQQQQMQQQYQLQQQQYQLQQQQLLQQQQMQQQSGGTDAELRALQQQLR